MILTNLSRCPAPAGSWCRSERSLSLCLCDVCCPWPGWSCTASWVVISLSLLQSQHRLLASLCRSLSLSPEMSSTPLSEEELGLGGGEVVLDISGHWLVQTVGGQGGCGVVKGQSRGYNSLSRPFLASSRTIIFSILLLTIYILFYHN